MEGRLERNWFGIHDSEHYREADIKHYFVTVSELIQYSQFRVIRRCHVERTRGKKIGRFG